MKNRTIAIKLKVLKKSIRLFNLGDKPINHLNNFSNEIWAFIVFKQCQTDTAKVCAWDKHRERVLIRCFV